ncbi:MAG TPA: hypothetical protein VGP53_02355 [Acidimicrobiales bacterium]|nr:hypothetical protein [Acidimicrobiales bacterium]
MGLTRRRLLVGAGAVSATVVLGPIRPLVASASMPLADDPVRQLLAAYVSTLVPGPGDDPAGTPGAVEAGSVAQLEEQVPYVIPVLVTDLTGAALLAHGQPFPTLTYHQREQLLVTAFADPARAPAHLVALAVGAGTFYGDFRNRVGGTHLGFPGPSAGYLSTYTDRNGHGQPQADAVPA